MSAPASCCNPCDPKVIVEVPGVQGDSGTNGTNGGNAFTVTTTEFIVPAINGSTAIGVADGRWIGIQQLIYIEDAGVFQVTAHPSDNVISILYLDYSINTHAADFIGSGAKVSPSGSQVAVSGITAFTDNTGGTPTSTLASTVGIQTLSLFIAAATIANGDLLTNYVPGYAFKLVKFDARCAAPVTTGGKSSTLNLEINTTNVTGGSLPLSGTYALGAAQAGTAITADNVGTSTDSFSIEAAGTTAFIEGGFWLIVSIANMDTVNALSSLGIKTNALLTALAP